MARTFHVAAGVSALSFLASLISFASGVYVAKLFGASMQMDLYLVAMSGPFFVMGLWSGVVPNVVIPWIVPWQDSQEYRLFCGLLFQCAAILAFIAWVAMFLLAPSIARVLAPDLDAALTGELIHLLRLGAAVAACSVVASILAALHNVAKKFIVATLAPCLTYLGLLAAAAAFSEVLGVRSLICGILGGYAVAIPLLYYRIRSDIGLSLKCWTLRREAAGLTPRVLLVAASMLSFSSCVLADAYWAPRIGPAELSYLGYCHRLLIAVGNILSAGPATVLLPRLSSTAAAGDWKRFESDVRFAVRAALTWCALAAAAVSVVRFPLVRLLFERGNFSPDATAGVAGILPGMFWGMVPMTSVVILFKVLHAQNDLWVPAGLGIVWSGLYFAGSWFSIKSLGLDGIVLSYLVSWWLVFAAAMLRASRRGKAAWALGEELWFACRLAVALCAAVAGGIGIREMVSTLPVVRKAADIVRCAGGAGGCLAAFLFFAHGLFRMKEVSFVQSLWPNGCRKFLSSVG